MRQKIGRPFLVIIEENQHDKLEEIARRFNIKKAEATRRIIETGLDTYAFYEKLGVVKMAEVVKRNREEREEMWTRMEAPAS